MAFLDTAVAGFVVAGVLGFLATYMSWRREDKVLFRQERLVTYRKFKTEAELAVQDFTRFQQGRELSRIVSEIQLISQSSKVSKMVTKFLEDGQAFEWALKDEETMGNLMEEDLDEALEKIEASLDTFDEVAQKDLGMKKVPTAQNRRNLRQSREKRYRRRMIDGY